MTEGTGPAAHWDAALAEGRLLIQRTPDGTMVFPPRAFAPGSGAPLEWVEASGLGTVHSITWMPRRPPEPATNAAIVELAEGPRMMARIDGITMDDAAGIGAIGMAVVARIVSSDDGACVVFVPAGEA